MNLNTAQKSSDNAVKALSEPFQLRRLWKAHRVATILSVILVLVLTTVTLLLAFAPSRITYAIDNYGENGSAAIANIGNDKGLKFTQVESPDIALSLAQQSNSTLVISHLERIPKEVIEKINRLSNPVVILIDSRVNTHELEIDLVPTTTSSLVSPDCENPISRAGSLQPGNYGIKAKSADQACYPDAGGYLWVHQSATTQRGERYYIADSTRIMNSQIATTGNASILLSTISSHSNQIIWWIGNDTPLGSSRIIYTPPYLPQILLLLGILFFTAALVYGRRFGPLVHEDMPVTVSSLETMDGRANLYYKSRDYKYILNTNRAWLLNKLSRKTGLTKSSSPKEVSNIISQLTKMDPTKVYDVLYRANASNRHELQSLIQKLSELESESNYDN